jgi:ATP-binding cassette subfamily B protein
MTIGSLTAFVGLMWRFFQPIHMVAHMSRMFNRAATSAQRILEVLDTQPEIYTKTGAKRIETLDGPIEFRNVSFSYDGVRRVLKNISFTIEPGEMVGLCGQSGSGKTTLVNLLCRFYDVTDGQILIDGTDIRDYKLEDLRELVGVVLQEPYLFRGTIAENVAYGKAEADIRQIIRASKAANVHDAIVGFPDGYDTMVGERGHTLSGGERQRVSIARAILDDPQLLILDEATSNVDTETEREIQAALDRLVQDRTTIAIAHRLSTLRKADRLIVLHKGEMVEMGSHADLESKPDGEYARLLKMQKEMRSYVALNG